jgi:hypothetical protein
MEMVAHNPAAAKRVGVPQSVGKDFVAADKGKAVSYSKAKGDVHNTSYATGGPVLGRKVDFMKIKDEFRDPDEGDASADEDQKYGKSGEGAGKGFVKPPKNTPKVLK